MMITGPFDFDLARNIRRAKGIAGQSPIRIAAEALLVVAELGVSRNIAIKEYNAKADRFKQIGAGNETGMNYAIPTGTIGLGSRAI